MDKFNYGNEKYVFFRENGVKKVKWLINDRASATSVCHWDFGKMYNKFKKACDSQKPIIYGGHKCWIRKIKIKYETN